MRRSLVLLSAWASDVVMTASQSLLEDLQRSTRLAHKKIVVNPFGVPLERFVRHASTSSQTPREGAHRPFRLLHVSTYSDYKNLTTLLQAIRNLAEHGTCDVSLVTTADPWQFPEVEVVSREVDQALAAHPQVAPFVKFTGSVPYDNVSRLYQDADLFVFPSLAESFGHPLVEAMAGGLPILASDIPICREICEDVAVYFDPLDPKDLAEKVSMLRDNSNLRGRLGESGRKQAERHFDWKDHVQRLVEILERVAADA
jgi:glycosyltransferase involved in cell wall biosynthesis